MPASDQIVTAKAISRAQLELQRQGINKAMALLKATEPDLGEFLMEAATQQYHQILHTGASEKQARRIHNATLTLVLVSIGALRNAHATLWKLGEEDPPTLPPAPPPPDPS